MTLPSLLTRKPLPWENGLPDAPDATITTLALVAVWEIVVMSEEAGDCALSVVSEARANVKARMVRISPSQSTPSLIRWWTQPYYCRLPLGNVFQSGGSGYLLLNRFCLTEMRNDGQVANFVRPGACLFFCWTN